MGEGDTRDWGREVTAWLQDWLGRRAEPFADSDRVDDAAEAAEGVPEARAWDFLCEFWGDLGE